MLTFEQYIAAQMAVAGLEDRLDNGATAEDLGALLKNAPKGFLECMREIANDPAEHTYCGVIDALNAA